MLVLTRKATQQIQVGENIVITILQVKGNSVRVGIEAPREVRVLRGELRDRETGSEEMGRPAPETLVTEEMTVVPQPSRMSQEKRVGSVSTSSRQAPLDVGRLRDLRQSVIMRFPVAEAATDAPIEREAHRPNRVRELVSRR